jgi:transposase InsO family protein
MSVEDESLVVDFFLELNGRSARFLIDTGASCSYVSEAFADDMGLSRVPCESFGVLGAFGQEVRRSNSCLVEIELVGHRFDVVCRAVPLSSYDLILGRDWISRNVERTDWTNNEWYLRIPSGPAVVFKPGVPVVQDLRPHTLQVLEDVVDGQCSRHQFKSVMKSHRNELFVCLPVPVDPSGPREENVSSFPSVFPPDGVFCNGLRDLCRNYSVLFDPIECASERKRVVEHLVETGDANPVSQPVRQMSPALLGELKDRLGKLERNGFIRPSVSSWSSPILFAKNSSGTLRFCVDYRALNSVTKKDRHPLPLIQECFDALVGAKFFTKIDLQQGFHQMRISPGDVPKTAFGSKYGHFEWLVMPFGLVNAPSTFQRMMTHILKEFIDDFVQVYLDDILIYSKNEADHLLHVEKVLKVLLIEELKCSGKKCSFGQTEIQYVGHMVSHNHVRPMKDKLDAINEWPRPTNVYDVRSFLGLCGYYRRYISNFAKIACPLHALTGGNVTKKQKVLWLPVHELAFLALKTALVSAPVLLMPDVLKAFVMETDASDFAVGAVLLQEDSDLCLHPVAYESKKLNSSQCNYPAQERELFAIIHAYRKWSVYLDGAVATTVCYTDHASLQYFSTQRLPSKRLARWVEEFAEMDIEIRYKKGSENVVPDALSRRSDLLVIKFVNDELRPSDWPLIVPYLKLGRRVPLSVAPDLLRKAVDLAEFFDVDEEEETLIWRGRPGHEEYSPFIESPYRWRLLRQVHDEAGHRGRDATLNLLRGRGWWSTRYQDVCDYVKTCAQCQVHERPHDKQETWQQVPLPLVGPFERWSADFISMTESKKHGWKWILTLIDHCTGWPIAVPMKEATSTNIAEVILRDVITPFGLPREFLTDRGSNFLSNGLLKFLSAGNIKKLNTSGYHPRTNGKNERYNGILEAALFRMNASGDPARWEDHFPAALYSTRIHINDSSKFSPFELLYGVRPRLPSDNIKLVAKREVSASEQQLQNRIDDLNAKRMKALEGGDKKASANKKRFDDNLNPSSCVSYRVGDSVKLRNESHTKGQPRWFGPFEIIAVRDNNVYILMDHNGEEYSRPVNGNHLRPVSLRSVITNEMWSVPPAIQLDDNRREVKVSRDLSKAAKVVAKLPVPAPVPSN